MPGSISRGAAHWVPAYPPRAALSGTRGAGMTPISAGIRSHATGPRRRATHAAGLAPPQWPNEPPPGQVGARSRLNQPALSGTRKRMDQRTVDFVIVGAGSAGAALANRLTENGRHQVLLLEAGGETHPLSRVPISYARFINRPGVNWLYASEPEATTGGRQSRCRAERCSAARVPSTAWCGCAASGRTTTTGRSSATAAGASRTCCRSSAASRATAAATDEIRGRGGPAEDHRHRRERAALRQPVRGRREHRDHAQSRLQRRASRKASR